MRDTNIEEFYQDGPEIRENQYTSDRLLLHYTQSIFPKDVYQSIAPDLERFGARCTKELLPLAELANSAEPQLIKYDGWGKKIDQVVPHQAWLELHKVAAEEGIVATAYEKQNKEYSRLHQAIKLYLFHPVSAFVSCPLAMTDGAAHVLERLDHSDLGKRAFSHLTTRDPKEFWTSGQWMTERSGGSDVGRSETTAFKEENGFSIYGTKYFTSAATANMTLTLARLEGAPQGSAGLSLFLVPLDDKQAFVQNADILRLKEKLGTKALPTAEISMQGMQGYLVGEENKGVKNISGLLTLTRFYNSVCATGAMRKIYALAEDFSYRRSAFGKTLDQHPLHVEILSKMHVEIAGALSLCLQAGLLLGKYECETADENELAELRLLVPLLKLFTGKQVMACTSELLEVFGGSGYMEDTGTALLHRDAQVFSLWEGTTNILSLDVLRAIEKSDALGPFLNSIKSRCEASSLPEAKMVLESLAKTGEFISVAQKKDSSFMQTAARSFAMAIIQQYAAGLLIERAEKTGHPRDVAIVERWCLFRNMSAFAMPDESHIKKSRLIALD